MILAAAVLMLMASAAETMAQASMGIGYSLNLNKESATAGREVEDLHGVNFRLLYNFELADDDWGEIGLESGLLYDFLSSRSDAKFHQAMTGLEQNEHYLSVPCYFNYSYDFGDCKPYFFAGPVLSFGLSSQTKLLYRYLNDKSKESDGSIVLHNYSDKVTAKISDDPLKTGELVTKAWQAAGGRGYKWFDVKVAVGVGVTLMENIDLRATYSFGLLNRYDGKLPDVRLLTDQLYLTLAYAF